jgi:hypothetical protein
MIGMTFSEMFRVEKTLLKEIEKEKRFTWHKLFKIMELEALISKNNTL